MAQGKIISQNSPETGPGDAEGPVRRLTYRPRPAVSLVGDTGFEPVTSSVSKIFGSCADQHKHENPQVTPRRSAQVSPVGSRSTPLGAARCSQSAPPQQPGLRAGRPPA